MSKPGITVAIPTLERPAYLVGLLQDLLAEGHRPFEVLIVDQSPATSSAVESLVGDHPDLVSYHRVPYRSLPRSRNRAWRRARHDAILFLDDDVRCGPGLLEEHLRTLRQPGVGLVAGGLEEPEDASGAGSEAPVFGRWTAMPRGSFAGLDERDVDHARGANFSVWRQALARVGGFDEGFAGGSALYEELDLCLRLRRAGYRIRFNGRARVEHLCAPAGGCRTEDPAEYARGLAHNRARLIGRHLRWFHKPVAWARLMVSGTSLALRRGSPRLLAVCAAGALRGSSGLAVRPESREPAGGPRFSQVGRRPEPS